MSPQQPEFVALNKKVDEIHHALIGDPFKGVEGIVTQHNMVMEDMYGIGPDGKPIEGKHNSALKRISNLEEKQNKVLYVFTGVVGLAVAIKLGITVLFEKVFK